jgi:hypothetical protein
MTKKNKTTLLTGLFLLGLLTGLQAQDKQEYAIVTVEAYSIVVKKHTKERFDIEKGVDFDNALIMKVEEMEKEGWEVVNVTATSGTNGSVGKHIFYMRKKIKE